MTEFLHFIGVLSGVAGIVFAVFASINVVSACSFPDNMKDKAWAYAKKAYKFLCLCMLALVLMICLSLI